MIDHLLRKKQRRKGSVRFVHLYFKTNGLGRFSKSWGEGMEEAQAWNQRRNTEVMERVSKKDSFIQLSCPKAPLLVTIIKFLHISLATV